MLRFLIDHDFNERILRGLRSRAELDAVLARTAGLAHKPDPVLLSWAAAENRILISHDLQTMPGFAIARVRNGDAMRGIDTCATGPPDRKSDRRVNNDRAVQRSNRMARYDCLYSSLNDRKLSHFSAWPPSSAC